MTRLARLALSPLILVSLLLPASVRAEQGAPKPFELVRSLRANQDLIAHGDKAAHAGQGKLLSEIGAQLVRFDADVWKDPKNERAVVIYTLSGGDPAVLKRVLGLGVLAGIEENLAKGVLAYAEGRSAEAELLVDIDTRPLDSTIAGHVALVQSGLVLRKDLKKALVFLDEARLRSPGTLVEEAALRRQAFLVLAAGDRDRFETLSSRYLSRFGDSVYAESFQRQFAAEVVGKKYAADSGRLKRIEAMLEGLVSTDRLQIYLAISEEGIVRGQIDATRMAAEHASHLAGETSAAHVRADLFRGAALIVTEEFERGHVLLKHVDRSQLDRPEAELLDAALSLAGQLRQWPEAGGTVVGLQEVEAKATSSEEPIVLATSKALAAAQKAGSRADQILKEMAK